MPIQEHDEAPRPRRKRRRRRRGSLFLAILLFLGASGALAIFGLTSATDLLAFGKPDQQIELTIEEGMGLRTISALLGEKGVIEHPFTFSAYARLRGKGDTFQAGDYILNSNMSYDRIITALRIGDTVKEEVRITFHEGMSLREIADLLEENEVCDADALIECLQTAEFDYEFLNMLPEDELRFYRLEGYLFPDTYDFYVGENVQSVAKKFLRNFSARVMGEVYEEIQDAGMTLDQAITLASIIQKEAGNLDEMVIVSSVFHNRIDNLTAGLPMLQSDVTVHYAEDLKDAFGREILGRPQTEEEQAQLQKILDAYNTYVCQGLPAGPICSPGLDAIHAAVSPEETNYYFFVTDSEGKYYYSSTLNEHYANVRRAAAAGGATHGTDVQ